MNTATKPRFTYNDIYETIREYHWMIRELERLKNTQPGDSPVTYETKRRRQKRERAERFEERIAFIQANIHIVNEKEHAVMECFMDGMSRADVSRHLEKPERTVYRILEKAVTALFESQNEGERL